MHVVHMYYCIQHCMICSPIMYAHVYITCTCACTCTKKISTFNCVRCLEPRRDDKATTELGDEAVFHYDVTHGADVKGAMTTDANATAIGEISPVSRRSASRLVSSGRHSSDSKGSQRRRKDCFNLLRSSLTCLSRSNHLCSFIALYACSAQGCCVII